MVNRIQFILSALLVTSTAFSANLPTGPNHLQASPTLLKVSKNGNNLAVAGTLKSVKNTTFKIQVFSNPTKTKNTEGQTFLGQFRVTTNNNGSASFKRTIHPSANVKCSNFISATATRIANGRSTDTSEFSTSVRVSC